MYRNKKRSNTLIIIMFSCFMLISGFFIGKVIESKDKKEHAALAVKTVDATNENEVELKKDAKLIFKTSYKRCNHFKESEESIPEKFVGINESKFEKYAKYDYPRWDIIKFSSDKVILSKEQDTYCEEHYIIGQENGTIIIYKYENAQKVIIKKTEISIANLPQVDQEQIKEGMVFNTLDEVNMILEDYSS